MAQKSNAFTVHAAGSADLSRLPTHIGLQIISRLAQQPAQPPPRTHYATVTLTLQLASTMKTGLFMPAILPAKDGRNQLLLKPKWLCVARWLPKTRSG